MLGVDDDGGLGRVLGEDEDEGFGQWLTVEVGREWH